MMTDVTLVRSRTPLFPRRCLRCGMDPHDVTVTVRGRPAGWWRGKVPVQTGDAVDVPVCSACQEAFIALRERRGFAIFGNFVAAMILAAIVAVALGPGGRRGWFGTPGIVVTVVVLVFLPMLVYDFLKPKPFEMTVDEMHVHYEFADLAYAMDFRQLNFDSLG